MMSVFDRSCEIRGSRRDWQILWSDAESATSLVGMTPKMKEQLDWCGCYLTRFQVRSPHQPPLFRFDKVKRVGLDHLLLYTMIHRRLRNNPAPDYVYYTFTVPTFLPCDSEGEVVMHLHSILTGKGDTVCSDKIRMNVYLDQSPVPPSVSTPCQS